MWLENRLENIVLIAQINIVHNRLVCQFELFVFTNSHYFSSFIAHEQILENQNNICAHFKVYYLVYNNLGKINLLTINNTRTTNI